MNENQQLLRDLDVNTDKLKQLIIASQRAGASGAKLSGAGGGDCMIAMATREKQQAVEDEISLEGGEVMHVSINALGARIE